MSHPELQGEPWTVSQMEADIRVLQRAALLLETDEHYGHRCARRQVLLRVRADLLALAERLEALIEDESRESRRSGHDALHGVVCLGELPTDEGEGQ